MNKKIIWLLLILAIILTFVGCTSQNEPNNSQSNNVETPDDIELPDISVDNEEVKSINEDGEYSSTEEVALYIHIYEKLPSNFITKKKAMDLGWESSKGNLWDVTDKKSIGGDKFGNREGLLPKAEGRVWYECDVNYKGGFRDAERIVFSNDGLIYYTNDHYESFEQLY